MYHYQRILRQTDTFEKKQEMSFGLLGNFCVQANFVKITAKDFFNWAPNSHSATISCCSLYLNQFMLRQQIT